MTASVPVSSLMNSGIGNVSILSEGLMLMGNNAYEIIYQFQFDAEDKRNFKVRLDPETTVMIPAKFNGDFAWTKLEYRQCPCCQLTKDKHSFCPIAVNIAGLVETFKDKISHEKCIVRCKTTERSYLKKTSVMEGLSSLLGLIMATSACPEMSIFRPMARFHLPFSTIEETIVRSTTMYLLRQFFIYKDSGVPDWDLKKLYAHYETVKTVNAGLLERIRGLHDKDADRNAIFMFHSISQILSTEIETDLNTIKHLLKASINP